MASAVIGEGVIKITADTSPAKTGLRALPGFAGNEGGSAASSFARIFKANLLAQLSSRVIVGALSGIKSAVTEAFSGGWTRLTNIETASAKLRAIGADVKGSMDSVSESVDGTRFALSDAADMAAVLSMSGIKAGQDMTRWLKLTANAATFNNVEFTDMQRVIQKVVQSGKAAGDTFNQLPMAVSALSQKLGKTPEEIRKLASAGKISAEDFRAAMEDTLGSAAVEVGKTFGATMANIRTAMNATMANLLEPVRDGLLPIIQQALPLFKLVRDAAKGVGQEFGNWLQPRAEAFAATLEKVPGIVENIGGFLRGLNLDDIGMYRVADGLSEAEVAGYMFGQRIAWIRDGLQDFGDRAGQVTQSVRRSLESMWRGLSGQQRLFKDSPAWFKWGREVRGIVENLWEGFRDFFDGLREGFGSMEGMGRSILPALTMLTGPLGLLRSAVMELAEGFDFRSAGATFGASLRPIIDGALELYDALSGVLVDVLRELLPILANVARSALPALGQAFQALRPLVSGVLGTLVKLLAPLGDLFVELADVVSGVLGKAFELLAPIIGSLVKSFGSIIEVLVTRLSPIIGTLARELLPVLNSAIEHIGPAVTALFDALSPLLSAFFDLVDLLMPVLIPALKFLADILIGAVKGAIDGVRMVVEGLTGVITGVVEFIKAIFAGDWAQAWESFKQIVEGIITAIGGAIWTWLNVTVVNLFRNGLLNIAKFFSGGWANIRAIGEQALNAIRSFFKGVWDDIVKFFSGRLTSMNQSASQIFGSIRDAISSIITSIRSTISSVMNNIRGTWDSIWGTIRNIGSNAWNWIRDTAIGAFNTMKSRISDAFTSMRTTITNVWNSIRGAVGRPINVVIRFINDGILKGFNFVRDKLGIGKAIAPLTPLNLQGYAKGGFVNLPWSSAHRDPFLGITRNGGMFRFEGEEFIFPRDMTRRHRRAFEAMLAGDLQIPEFAKGGVVRPVPQGHSGWNGGRYRSGGYHGGLDFPAPMGQAIAAMWAGQVRTALRLNRSYGHHAILNHGAGLETLYAHMSNLLVSVGQAVKAGQTIGRVGSTGNSTGPHLHLEVRRNGLRVNPEPYLSGAVKAPEQSKGFLAAIAEGFKSVTAWFGNIMDKVTGPFKLLQNAGGGIVGDIVRGVGSKLKDDLSSWIKKQLGIPGYATGTMSALRGLGIVGERGPELVNFRGGEGVFTNRQLLQLLTAPRSSAPPQVVEMIHIEHLTVEVQEVAELEEFERFRDMLSTLPRKARQGMTRVRYAEAVSR